MKKVSLVHAKNHLSEVVDDAEHRGVSTVIHRHGKPCAVIVPLAIGAPAKVRPRLSEEAWQDLLKRAAESDNATFSAVQDIREGRDKR